MKYEKEYGLEELGVQENIMIIDIVLAFSYSILLVFYIRYSDELKWYNWGFIFCTILLISMFVIFILYECGIVKIQRRRNETNR